ncbi:MAG: hypothetical protein JNK40_15850 [Chromatiales bacterium]|nr:hypothetical protein [Chromatiales bacterium]
MTDSKVVSIFAGYPSSLIQEVCGVSKVTACLWKKGRRVPSKRAVRLFRLHVQGQIVPRTWNGWRFHEKTGELVSPEGWTFHPGRIRALEILCRNGELRRLDPALWDSVKNLLAGHPG